MLSLKGFAFFLLVMRLLPFAKKLFQHFVENTTPFLVECCNIYKHIYFTAILPYLFTDMIRLSKKPEIVEIV